MDVQIKQTNTTEVSATLSHDDIVAYLGLAVALKGGIPSDQPGKSVSVKLVPVDGADQFTAEVDVVVDHNAKPDVEAEAPKGDDAPAPAPVVSAPVVAPTLAIPTVVG